MRASSWLAATVSIAAGLGCASSSRCRMPKDAVGATAHVVVKIVAFINAQPSACQEQGPLYVRLSGRVAVVGQRKLHRLGPITATAIALAITAARAAPAIAELGAYLSPYP